MMQQFEELLAHAKHIVLIVPENPDADALGSASALYSYMLQKHKKVSFFCNSTTIKRRYKFIAWVEKIRNNLPAGGELFIACGVQSLEGNGISIKRPTINIDNDPSNTAYGELNIIDASALSITTVVYDLLQKAKAKINAKMATALYAGIVEKSDMFQKSDVNGMTFAFAKELLDYGALHAEVVKYLQKYSTLSQLRLIGKMLESMRLVESAQIALFYVDRALLQHTGAELEDTQEALERALWLPSVRMSVAIVERKAGGYTLLFRSDEEELLKIAVVFGADAKTEYAVCELLEPLSAEEIQKKILQEVKKIEKKEK